MSATYKDLYEIANASGDWIEGSKRLAINQAVEIICGGEFSAKRFNVLEKLEKFGFELIEMYPDQRITFWRRGLLTLSVSEDIDGTKYFVEPNLFTGADFVDELQAMEIRF